MFHRLAIIFNGVLFAFIIITYFSKVFVRILEEILSLSSTVFQWINIMFLVECIVGFTVISFLCVFIVALITKIKVGKAPLNNLWIAYKYGLSDSVTSSSICRDNEVLQGYERVHICYERRVGPFGIAHGAIIGNSAEHVNQNTKEYLDQHGYQTFHIKPINNAVYISCPTLPWLFFFGVWLVLRIAYPKMYKFSKAHKLSAYPVIEVYNWFRVVLVAPLSRQDDCVVPEAQCLIKRSCSRPDSSLSTTTNLSRSPSHTKHSPAVTVDCENVTGTTDIHCEAVVKLTQIPASTTKIANGHVQLSVEE